MYTLEFSLRIETESYIDILNFVLWYHLPVIYIDDLFSLQNILKHISMFINIRFNKQLIGN